MFRKFTVAVALAAFFAANQAVDANPVGDFFKRLGRSISHQHRKTAVRPGKRSNSGTAATESPAPLTSPSPPDSNKARTGAQRSATPQTVRAASGVAQDGQRRDVPYGIPVPNKDGFVTSPYAPSAGFVDVRGFPSGTEVKDPYTGKVFLTP